MRSFFKYIALGIAFFSISCENNLYEDVPQGKVYIPHNGFYSINQYDLGEPQTEIIRVYRSGLQEGAVTVNLSIDPTLITAYNTKNSTSLISLPAECYSLPATVTIPDGKADASVTIQIYPEKIKDKVGYDVEKYVLPVKVTSVSGNAIVNETIGYSLIAVVAKKPTVSISNSALESLTFEDDPFKTDDLASTELAVVAAADFPKNKWDLDLKYEIAPDEVAAYNTKNNTAYELLPAEAYSAKSWAVTIKAGSQNVSLPITVDPTKVVSGKMYLLPVRLKSTSKFEVNSAKSIIYVEVFVKNNYDGWYTVEALAGNWEYPGGEYPRYVKALSPTVLQTPFSYWTRFEESSWADNEDFILTFTVNKDNTVKVDGWSGSTIRNNKSTWNPTTKEFLLDFTVDIPDDGTYPVKEKMKDKRVKK